MKPRYLAGIIIAFVVLGSLINSILGNIIASLIEQYLGVNAKLLVIPFLILAAFLFGYELRDQIMERFMHKDNIGYASTFARNRERMLDRVEAVWIKGVLDKSLHNITRIELDIELGAEYVDYPWEAIVQRANMPDQTITSSRRILDIFHELGDEMLILGAPGAGKTTMLLDLTRGLLIEARKDKELPIPIVFNLSSWSKRRRSLKEWLIEELSQKYDVPLKIATEWIDRNYIQPLLDGLDEVQDDYREGCVDIINNFRGDAQFRSLAVCSRTADYELLGVKLRLNGAVKIKPLTTRHISVYFSHKSLVGIKKFVNDNPHLEQLLDTPLMLSIMALTFKNQQQISLQPSLDLDELQYELFSSYIDAMFERRGKSTKYSRQATIYYLSWLARSMLKQSQTIFLLERLQPEWLNNDLQRRSYFFIDRLVFPFLFGTGIGALSIIIASAVEHFRLAVTFNLQTPTFFNSITFGLLPQYAIFIGIISIILGVFFGGLSLTTIKVYLLIRNLLIGAILGGMAGYLAEAFDIYIISKSFVFGSALGIYVFVGALVGVMVSAIAGGPSLGLRNVQIAEKVRWSLSKSLPFIMLCLILVPSLWLAIFLVGRTESNLGLFMFRDGSLVGLVIAVIVGLLGGLVTDEIESKAVPNQGIKRSVITSFTVGFGILFSGGALGAIIGGLLEMISGGMLGQATIQIGNRAASGILAGIIAGFSEIIPFSIAAILSYGGFAVLSHLALRLVLWRGGLIPLNYVYFLNYCVDRIFLHKVGGGYTFIHRILMETFAKKQLDGEESAIVIEEKTAESKA